MLKTRRSLFFANLVAIAAASALNLAYASSGAGPAGGSEFPDTVGTHIYSPGTFTPGHSFKLEMQMLAPAMKVLHADMAMNSSSHRISCTMQAGPKHRGMVVLTCTPAA